MLGALHIGAGLLLLKERRRLSIGVTLPGKPRWANAAFETYRVLRQPWVRVVLISVFIEGMAMFGALAYVGADLHHRVGLGLGMVGALLASFGAGALLFAASAVWLVPKLASLALRREARCCSPPATASWWACRGCGLPCPPSPVSASASHAARRPASECHADGAGGAWLGGLDVRLLSVHGPIPWGCVGGAGGRPLRRPPGICDSRRRPDFDRLLVSRAADQADRGELMFPSAECAKPPP